MLARYILSLLVYLPFLVLAIPAALFLPLFARDEFGLVDNASGTGVEPRLPKWLGWFMTPDNSLLGDTGWKHKHPKGAYWDQVKWLLRNPAYGLAWGPLAYTPKKYAWFESLVDNDGYLILGDDGVFEWTSYWDIPFTGRVLKTRFGWILGTATEGTPCLFLCSVRIKRERA